MAITIQKNGQPRCRVYRRGKVIADKTFPKSTNRSKIRDWERKIKLGLISPEFHTSKSKGKVQFTAFEPALVDNSDPTFAQFLPLYFEQHAAIEVLESTLKTKRQILENHWLPSLGNKPLSEIRPQDIRQLQAKLWDHGQGLAVQTIRNILAVASQVFMAAVAQEKMEYNPCSSVKRVKDLKSKRKPSPPFWSFSERNRFLTYAREHDWRIFELVAFAVTTGLRPGELWGLQREQLDFRENFVLVDRAWCRKTNRLNDWTKGKIDRKVTVPPEVMQFLARKAALRPKDFVFSGEIGFSDFPYRYLKPMCREAGVKEIRFHDLRHTFASHCVLKGLHQVEIRDLLGHARLSSTDVYMHLSEDDKNGATDCLAEGLSWVDKATPKVINLIHQRSENHTR